MHENPFPFLLIKQQTKKYVKSAMTLANDQCVALGWLVNHYSELRPSQRKTNPINEMTHCILQLYRMGLDLKKNFMHA